MKHHLGDSVYVEEDDGFIVLASENGVDTNGMPIIVSAVYLSAEAVCEFQRWLANRKVRKVVDRLNKLVND